MRPLITPKRLVEKICEGALAGRDGVWQGLRWVGAGVAALQGFGTVVYGLILKVVGTFYCVGGSIHVVVAEVRWVVNRDLHSQDLPHSPSTPPDAVHDLKRWSVPATDSPSGNNLNLPTCLLPRFPRST